jgi:hypothetical protein
MRPILAWVIVFPRTEDINIKIRARNGGKRIGEGIAATRLGCLNSRTMG